MASENETIADIIAEVRRNAESSQMGHKSFLAPSAEYWKSLANRIDAAWSRVRGIVAELAIAVRECNGEKYHVTLLRDADAIASGETPNCPSLVQKQGGGLDNSPGNAAAMREALVAWLNAFDEFVQKPRNGEWTQNPCGTLVLTPLCAAKLVDMTNAALAAPARNCDKFKTREEARAYFDNIVCQRSNGSGLIECKGCHLDSIDNPHRADCRESWLFATAEKGADA